ncbi:efflux RND transporter periplasmic adaptor subunit [Emticicia sp. 21SJ11W-3]|uniref:efflux RND transporter periplasmic adaptor subunit n=1 Tax=Emticicia sp. 21SJ11W-3 TaxID=2916755 RepID=UPI00209CAB88|nr:efflux RND transporter periplasmic adaptor subunit [Emticicia sp. 21SJ11W-3]UTA68433.1 efflux RND transporter periplasmic adaptor subunit [Emticicia sp. 21SJ11W-3]
MKNQQNLRRIGLLTIIVVAIGVGIFVINRADSAEPPVSKTADATSVSTITISRQKSERTLMLSAEARPYQSVTLFAKISGYLQKLYVDKGQNVKAGQTIAVIESPDLEQEKLALEADLKQKQSYLHRVESLLSKKYVTEQETDKARADVEMARARLDAQREKLSYTIIRAPFAGNVSARYADVGALLQAATSSQTSALPVVTVSQVNRLRITIFIEQADAASIRPGTPVDILVPGSADTLHASITRMTGELDARTRMMLAEIEYNNANNQILAGSFLKVLIHLPAQEFLSMPAQALVVKGDKYFAPVIKDNRVFYRPIKIGAGDGLHYRVYAGLNEGDVVALNVGNSLIDSTLVKVVNKPATK